MTPGSYPNIMSTLLAVRLPRGKSHICSHSCMLLSLRRMVLNLLPLSELVETNSVWQDSRPLDKETHHSGLQAGDLNGSSNLSTLNLLS